jgi:hypothetical protein
MRANGLKHETVTTGTGALTLTAVSGWPTYANAFGNTGTRMVDYVVQDSAGLPLEGGVGELALSTLVLTRSLVQWTWNGATYDNTAPTALSLASGTKRVICGPTVETGCVYASITTPGDNLGVMIGNSTTSVIVGEHNMINQRCLFFWAPIRRGGQISKVSLRIVDGYTGGSSSIKVGLYDIDEVGKPFNLLADFGNLGSLSASTTMTSATLGTPITVPPGDMYAIAVLPEFSGGSGTPTIAVSNGTIGGSPFGAVLSNTGINDRAIMCMHVNSRTSLAADASGLTYAVTGTSMPHLVLG